jgi:hypothetical protein
MHTVGEDVTGEAEMNGDALSGFQCPAWLVFVMTDQ